MKQMWTKKAGVAVISSVLAAAALVGCNRRDEQVSSEKTPGQKLDQAIADSREAGRDASARMEARTEDAKAAIERGADKTAQAFDDTKLTAEVKAALIKDEVVQASAINVDTKNGTVTLTGTVPSQTAKERALTLARNVQGVGSVQNNLNVSSDTRTSSSSSKD